MEIMLVVCGQRTYLGNISWRHVPTLKTRNSMRLNTHFYIFYFFSYDIPYAFPILGLGSVQGSNIPKSPSAFLCCPWRTFPSKILYICIWCLTHSLSVRNEDVAPSPYIAAWIFRSFCQVCSSDPTGFGAKYLFTEAFDYSAGGFPDFLSNV